MRIPTAQVFNGIWTVAKPEVLVKASSFFGVRTGLQNRRAGESRWAGSIPIRLR